MTINKYDIDLPDVDANGIAEDQQPTTTVPFVLDGALCDTGTAGQFDIGDSYPGDVAGVRLSFESAGNWSGVTITISGRDDTGTDTTEDLTGPSGSTVETIKYWSHIPEGGITVSGTVATDIEVGTVDEVVSTTTPVNWQSLEPYTAAALGVTGTINFDFQQSFDPIKDAPPSLWNSFQASKTADIVSDVQRHAVSVRLKVNSYSSGAELQFYVVGQ
jgi:hypothetical protein